MTTDTKSKPQKNTKLKKTTHDVALTLKRNESRHKTT